MKDDFEQDQQEQDGGGGDGGDDSPVDAILDEGGDTAFVATEEKQPIGKGTVAMFVILALAGAGTYFMYLRTGPQTATAAVDPKAQQVISKYMTDREKNLAGMKKMLRDTETVVKQFLKYPSVQQVPLADLTGNPFRITPSGEQTTASVNLDLDREKKKREEERLAVLRAVNNLQLQSVMSGGLRSSCMINNALYTEGQQVEQFTVEKVSPNSVIVRHGSYRFELKMQR
jgi:hypothetical protein